MAVSGLGVAYVAGGFVLLWSGYRNATIKDTLTSFLKGQQPSANPTGAPTVGVADTSSDGTDSAGGSTSGQSGSGGVTSVGGTVSGATEKLNQAAAMLQATAYGWTGAQWTALNNVAMRESGWNNLAENPGSGAFGIAQALGHGTSGTAGTHGNQYGANYGLSTAQAIAANNGSAGPQITWMLGYIKATYQTPEGAWNSEQTRGYY